MAIDEVKKIMIPTDGSDYSMKAAEFGISIGKMLNAEITAVYVIDTVVLDQVSKAGDKDSMERELKQDGERYLRYIKGLSERAGLRTSMLLLKGRPYEQIVHLAKSMNMDLIVMGTYGRRGADRILMGSVAERVIEYAHCPVLVVK
jgi:nucleotide-binding universal stress UspA family protein